MKTMEYTSRIEVTQRELDYLIAGLDATIRGVRVGNEIIFSSSMSVQECVDYLRALSELRDKLTSLLKKKGGDNG